MDNIEQSTSFSSDSSVKKQSVDRISDEKCNENIDEIIVTTEQEHETGAIDADKVDDFNDYDDVDDEENEEATADGSRSPTNKSLLASDAFDTFEFVPQDANVASTDSVIEDEIIPEASDWLDGSKLYTAHTKNAPHFVCIAYPGVIQNQDKVFATLGGREGLSKAVYEGLKLDLTFRPNDPYCKPTIGSFTNTRNLLLKIRRRKKVSRVAVAGSEDSSSGDEFEYQIEVIGIVDKMYIFDKLCDFQYLPITKDAPGKYKEILSSIKPTINDDRREYLSRNVPVFLPPLSFSRREVPVPYNFETETAQHREDMDNVIGTADRKKRLFGTIHIAFGHPDVPKEPEKIALEHLKKLPCQDGGLNALKKLFEERPLWSKVGINAHLDKVHQSYLKYLLPVVSYYFMNGPWKNLWCKFGYDPRKDPKAKMYQTLDYRVRSMAHRQKVEPKRGPDAIRFSQYGLKQQWSTTLIHQTDTVESSQKGDTAPIDVAYIFYPNHIPPYRQMRYQVCDVHHEEVQKWMHKNDGEETNCSERDGWCVPDFTNVCRDIISGAVEKLFAK